MILRFNASSFITRWAQKTGDSLIRLVYTSVARDGGFRDTTIVTHKIDKKTAVPVEVDPSPGRNS